MEVRSFKMPLASMKFNCNQRVFVIRSTGAGAAFCYGRFHGNGRWIKAWVHWDSDNNPDYVKFDVDDNCHIAKMMDN